MKWTRRCRSRRSWPRRNFVFGNNFGSPLFAPYVLSPADLALSNAMSGYWTRFAGTGNPNLPHDDDDWLEMAAIVTTWTMTWLMTPAMGV